MGCGLSQQKKLQDAFAAHQPLSVADVPDKEGEFVHLFGQAVHLGQLMVTPFGQLTGVAMKVVADENNPGGGRKKLFTAVRVMDFKLVSGGNEILVEGGDWDLMLEPSHYEKNILRDDKRPDGSPGTMQVKSGGDRWNLRNLPPLTIKPHASAWWAKFNGGADPLRGSSCKGQAPRGAREHVLKSGTLCAVLGRLYRTDDDRLKICCMDGGKGGSVITNMQTMSASIKDCPQEAVAEPCKKILPMHLCKVPS